MKKTQKRKKGQRTKGNTEVQQKGDTMHSAPSDKEETSKKGDDSESNNETNGNEECAAVALNFCESESRSENGEKVKADKPKKKKRVNQFNYKQ